MNEEMKVCPLCAEDIPVAAEVCSYCGARFIINRKGYCRSCHNMRDADETGLCVVCGEPLQDYQLESRLIDQEKPEMSSSPIQLKPTDAGAYSLQVLPIKGENVYYRFSAVFVDILIIALIVGCVIFSFASLTQGLDFSDQSALMSIFSGTILLSVPLIWFLYFFIFEGAFGTTPGKALHRLKVIKKDDGRLNWGQAAIRSLFSLVETNPIGAIVILATAKNQRIGDLVAGTLVVNKEKVFQAEMLPPNLTLTFHDHRTIKMKKLEGGIIERFMGYKVLKLVGISNENIPIQTKIQGHYFRLEFDMLCLNLQERFNLVFRKKVNIWRVVMFSFSMVLSLLIIVGTIGIALENLNMDRKPLSLSNDSQENQPSLALSATPIPSQTSIPTPTQRPTATAIPLPIEANFDTLADFDDGQLVVFVGRLAMMSSTICDYQCGLLLENPSNTAQRIILFVVTGDKPNQMKPLSDNYTKGDIQILLDDGSYAYVGYRLQVTGRKCTTTEGNPCISSIQKIEFYKIP